MKNSNIYWLGIIFCIAGGILLDLKIQWTSYTFFTLGAGALIGAFANTACND